MLSLAVRRCICWHLYCSYPSGYYRAQDV